MSTEPPSAHYSPLYLLDNIILSLVTNLKSNETAVDIASIAPNNENDSEVVIDNQSKTKALIQQRLLLLEATDFLMGNSLLEGALHLLDLSKITMVPAVRLVRAEPSGRCLFRVQMSVSPKHRKFRREGESISEYLCLLGSSYGQRPIPNTEEEGERANLAAGRLGFYCTCRSFFERCKGDPVGTSFCKHLLACRLAPFLVDRMEENKCYVEEVVTDHEYAEIMTCILCNDHS